MAGHAGRLPRVRPFRLRLLQPGGGPGACRPDRQGRGARASSRRVRGTDATASSDCSSAMATRLFNACVLAGPDGVIGSIARSICRSWGSTCSSIPATGRSPSTTRAGFEVGMHICYDGSFPETARVLSLLGADLLVLADELADAFGMRRRAHDPDPCHGEHRLRDGRQPRGRGERVPIHRLAARSSTRAAACWRGPVPIPTKSSRPRSTRLRAAEAPGARPRAGMRSIASAIAGRGSTKSWSRPTGGNDPISRRTGVSRAGNGRDGQLQVSRRAAKWRQRSAAGSRSAVARCRRVTAIGGRACGRMRIGKGGGIFACAVDAGSRWDRSDAPVVACAGRSRAAGAVDAPLLPSRSEPAHGGRGRDRGASPGPSRTAAVPGRSWPVAASR